MWSYYFLMYLNTFNTLYNKDDEEEKGYQHFVLSLFALWFNSRRCTQDIEYFIDLSRQVLKQWYLKLLKYKKIGFSSDFINFYDCI